jgi:hypothetical protein
VYVSCFSVILTLSRVLNLSLITNTQVSMLERADEVGRVHTRACGLVVFYEMIAVAYYLTMEHM